VHFRCNSSAWPVPVEFGFILALYVNGVVRGFVSRVVPDRIKIEELMTLNL